jgi:hypothetical protein
VGRLTASADYGTAAIDRSTQTSAPKRSDTVLVTSTTYNARGEAATASSSPHRRNGTVYFRSHPSLASTCRGFKPASIRRRFAPIPSSQVWTNPTTLST